MPEINPDKAEVVAELEALGAKLRKRKSGRLHTIDFSQSEHAITDQHLALITQLIKPEVIDLTGTQVTDDGIAILETVESLKLLTLNGTQVSTELLARMRKKMINCRIIFLG